jgi:outer membrane protein assembly factor BamE (lipoprotein component of BamABCDE complex)
MKIHWVVTAPAEGRCKRKLRLAAAILLLSPIILTSGCASPAETLDKSFVQQIQSGQDRATVRKLLGQPNWSRNGANGETADTYIYDEVVNSATSAAPSARDLKARTFSIRYDATGQVSETLLYESRTPVLAYHSSAYAGPTVTAEVASKIQAGVTTREELERTFQKPLVVNLHPRRWLELHWYQIEIGATVTHLGDEQGLHILVDDQGVVRDVAFYDTTDRQR